MPNFLNLLLALRISRRGRAAKIAALQKHYEQQGSTMPHYDALLAAKILWPGRRRKEPTFDELIAGPS